MHICGIRHIGADLPSWRGSRYYWSAVGILDFYWQLPRQFSEPRNRPLMICASGQVPRQHMKYHKGHAAASTIVIVSIIHQVFQFSRGRLCHPPRLEFTQAPNFWPIFVSVVYWSRTPLRWFLQLLSQLSMKRANAPASNLSDANRKGFASRAGFSASASSNMEILCANHAQLENTGVKFFLLDRIKAAQTSRYTGLHTRKDKLTSRLFALRIVFP